jgi:hypothetical protein
MPKLTTYNEQLQVLRLRVSLCLIKTLATRYYEIFLPLHSS